MNQHTRYIVFALAGWLLFSASQPTVHVISEILDGLGFGDAYFLFVLLRLIKLLFEIIGLAAVFIFTIPLLLSAWKEIRNK